jgi:branched-chain amino acid transport system permease protein
MDSKHIRIINIVAIVLLFLYLTVAESLHGAYVARIMNFSAIFAIAALSMNMVNGFVGMFSLGQAGFMAVGAYTSTILMMSPEAKYEAWRLVPMVPFLQNLHFPFLISIIAGGCMAAFFAFIVGFPVLRLRGDYLAIATLGFSEIIMILIANMQTITNGPIGINNIPSMPRIRFSPFNIGSLWWTFGLMAITAWVMWSLMKTSYGRAIKSVREDETAAEAMGVNLFKHKMYAFVLSGFMAGVAGGLLASMIGTIDPLTFRFILSFEVLLMVVLGGLGSISGSIVGAFIIRISLEVLRFVDQPIDFGFFRYPGIAGMRMVIYSLSLMLVIIFWSRGIFGRSEFSFDAIFRKIRSFVKGGGKR